MGIADSTGPSESESQEDGGSRERLMGGEPDVFLGGCLRRGEKFGGGVLE
jgi:hypothetical protein